MDSEFYKYKCDTRKYINLEGGYVMRLEFLGAAQSLEWGYWNKKRGIFEEGRRRGGDGTPPRQPSRSELH